jgi:hypothetical protein
MGCVTRGRPGGRSPPGVEGGGDGPQACGGGLRKFVRFPLGAKNAKNIAMTSDIGGLPEFLDCTLSETDVGLSPTRGRGLLGLY